MFTKLPSSSAAKPRAAGRGFTLMEVVIALTILGLIMGTLFAIIQGSVRAASQIEQLQRENDSINRFLELCRRTFTTLPSTATVKLTLLDQNTDSGQELTISGSTNCFGFGLSPISYEDTILGLRPDPDGATDQNNALVQYLCLSREDIIPETDDNSMAMRQEVGGLNAPDDQGRYWMPLLPNVIQLKWRFYKKADETWLEEWEESTWPDLIEVQLLMRDRLTPIRMVYSVPALVLTAGRGTTSTSSSSSSSSTSTSGSGGGGGGGGGGQGGGGQGGGGGGRGGSGGVRGDQGTGGGRGGSGGVRGDQGTGGGGGQGGGGGGQGGGRGGQGGGSGAGGGQGR